MRVFKLFFVSLVLVGVVGFVGAGAVVVNDAAFDYADTEVASAYLQLGYEDGRLQLTLSEMALEGVLPGVAVEVPVPERVDSRGNDILPDFFDLGSIETWKSGRDLVGFSVLHESTRLDEVTASYLAEMERLGFEAVLQGENMNSTTYLFTQGDERVRAVFDNEGMGVVRAYLRFL